MAIGFFAQLGYRIATIAVAMVISSTIIADPIPAVLAVLPDDPDPAPMMVGEVVANEAVEPNRLCASDDQEPCEQYRLLKDLNPEKYAAEKEACGCTFLIYFCKLSRTYNDYVTYLTEDGEVIRRVRFTTCSYGGCGETVPLDPVVLPS